MIKTARSAQAEAQAELEQLAGGRGGAPADGSPPGGRGCGGAPEAPFRRNPATSYLHPVAGSEAAKDENDSD